MVRYTKIGLGARGGSGLSVFVPFSSVTVEQTRIKFDARQVMSRINKKGYDMSYDAEVKYALMQVLVGKLVALRGLASAHINRPLRRPPDEPCNLQQWQLLAYSSKMLLTDSVVYLHGGVSESFECILYYFRQFCGSRSTYCEPGTGARASHQLFSVRAAPLLEDTRYC